MFGFLVELRNMMKEYMARLETKNEDNKGIGIICKCVMVISKLKKYWARFGDQLEAKKACGYICKCVPVNFNKWNI